MLLSIKNKKGISIIALLIALVLLSTFALFALWLLAGHSNITNTLWTSQQTFYIADAGLRVNAQKLQDNWSGWNNPANFPAVPFFILLSISSSKIKTTPGPKFDIVKDI